MNIKIGKNYVNKTWRFLAPSLREHGYTFVNKFNNIYKLAVGVSDTYLKDTSLSSGKYLYILIDKKYRPQSYHNFMKYVRCQHYYRTEYCPDVNLLTSRKNMLVLEIPKMFHKSYDKFLQGKYSEMYSKKELDKLYYSVLKEKGEKQENKKIDYEILSKTGTKALDIFLKNIEEEFDVKMHKTDLISSSMEWELPPKKQEEIFNYKKEDKIFFNENFN